MNDISQQRCFNHSGREAVACCPECRRYFCRECVTEHDDRVICASCLKTLSLAHRRERPRLRGLLFAVGCAASFMILWLFFYGLGQLLLLLPTTFHEGHLWRNTPLKTSINEDN